MLDFTESPVDRLVDMLSDPDSMFDLDQAVWLMGEAARWARESDDVLSPWFNQGWQAGYRARVAEENAAYPPPTYFVATDFHSTPQYDRPTAAERAAADVKARESRPGDHPAGPVPVWGPEWCGAARAHGRHRARDGQETFVCKGWGAAA